MNVIWYIRWERFKWFIRLGALFKWRERRRVRRELLETPGVDHLVRSVMDMRYGKHHWRVCNDMLEAEVITHGQGVPWWGPIGPLRNINTRRWLTSVWMEHRGGVHLHHGPHDTPYRDTEPLDDDGRTEK